MKNNLIWILVTDGAHARILQQENKAQPLVQVKALNHGHELTHEHGADRPGRAFESGTVAQHAYEPKTDWHDHQKELFIKELYEIFVKEHQEKKFNTVYLVCPPKILGFVRETFSYYMEKLPPVEKISVTEIIKDLTHQGLREIEEIILSNS